MILRDSPFSPSQAARRGMGVAVVVAMLAALLALANVAATPSAQALTNPGSNSWLRMVVFNHGGSSADQVYSRSEALAIVDRFDTMVALRWSFEDHIDAMKAKDPDFTVLAYMNGAFSKPKDASTMPDSWFLRDAKGNKVKSVKWGNFYMDPNNRGWQDWVSQRCADWIRLSGFDGCYLDDMGVGNMISDNLNAHPIDPRTGKAMDYGDWIGYTAKLIDRVTAENSKYLVGANGINHGYRYFEPGVTSRRMAVALDAGHAEGFMRGEKTGKNDFRDESRWKADVDMLVDAGKAGTTILAETKMWVSASKSETDRWRAYTYASFLLGTNGKSYLYFNPDGAGRAAAAHPYDNVDIGQATAAYSKTNGIYQRPYTNGLVMVNPTKSSKTVQLDGTYRTLSGVKVTKLTLDTNQGEILIRESVVAVSPGAKCDGKKATIVGTSGNDIITGTSGDDVIVAGGGDDRIDGKGGNDTICAGAGNDEVMANSGNDKVLGEAGNDVVWGRDGNDTIRGNGGTDVLLGDAGSDDINGGSDTDWCRGDASEKASCEGLVVSSPKSMACSHSYDRFTDVSSSAYYEQAVRWLFATGITTGTSAKKFSPDQAVTRGQMAVFIWRRFGSPAPASAHNFTDVAKTDYYNNAVAWMVDAGITTGTSARKFSPDATVTRAQMATFLWRAGGWKYAAPTSSFSDSSPTSYFGTAVAWLVAADITKGVTAKRFAPNDVVDRGQMAVFLWRASNSPTNCH